MENKEQTTQQEAPKPIVIKMKNEPLRGTVETTFKGGRKKMKLFRDTLPTAEPKMVGGKAKYPRSFNGKPNNFGQFVRLSQTAQMRPHIARGVYDFYQIRKMMAEAKNTPLPVEKK